ncbi:hypothetical protein NDN08_003921 [Rhodosorus marinus]|uniref:C2H2-type domain-containing protein n=1 Tax=Rhodosorus marinus TaxID=101924 RepID=A0AAV8UGT8_9RHOD|nr:hypothetical protein NDN08_003921 [Rhodosorus marinus]
MAGSLVLTLWVSLWVLGLPAFGSAECDRELAQRAREEVRKSILPVLGKIELLPPGCPLREERDSLLEQERSKVRLGSSLWKCGLCGKQFKSSWYLDKHLELRHTDYRAPEARFCYADLCGTLVTCGRPTEVRLSGGKATPQNLNEPSWCKRPQERDARTVICKSIIRECSKSPSISAMLEGQICDSVAYKHCSELRSWRRPSASGNRRTHAESVRNAFGIVAFCSLLFLLVLMRCIKMQGQTSPDIQVSWRMRWKHILDGGGKPRTA